MVNEDSERWRKNAIYNEVIMALIRHKNEMLDDELYRFLSKLYNDFTRSSLIDILFRLECKNIISVERVKKDVNKITLREDAPISPELRQLMEKLGSQSVI
jgi:hypothetical protein